MCTRASHQAGVSGRPVALLVLMLMCVAVAGDDGECGAELGGCNGTNAEGAAAQGKGTDKTAAVVPKPMANGARGFGEQFEWYSFDDGLRAAEAFAKPAVVVIHKSWCGACRNLGPVFAASEELMSLAKDFVMINVADDEEPRDAAWHPDGSYIPRIFFYDGVRFV